MTPPDGDPARPIREIESPPSPVFPMASSGPGGMLAMLGANPVARLLDTSDALSYHVSDNTSDYRPGDLRLAARIRLTEAQFAVLEAS